jgi:coenzyme F420-reducing hydrogenase beta subunit
MESSEFYQELYQAIELPFEVEQVEDIETNCGSVWITLKDGSIYYITIAKCEE